MDNPEQKITPSQRRSNALDRVRGYICKNRQDAYGDAEDSFTMIAEAWNWWLKGRGIVPKDHPGVTKLDICHMMSLMKKARAIHNPLHQDNLDDDVGYMAIAAAMAELQREQDFENLKQYRETGGQ